MSDCTAVTLAVTAHLPHAVKGVCHPVEAHQLVPAAGHTGGADGAAVQGKWGGAAVVGGTLCSRTWHSQQVWPQSQKP
jgi:hypothetical protein